MNQQTTVAGVGRTEPAAPEPIVVGDSCRHDLLALPPGGAGEPFRPETWLWSDARTRRILAWWSGTGDAMGLGARTALHDLIATHGAPGAVILDLGRTPETREVANMLGQFGVRLEHRAGNSHERSPERAFHGINRAVDRQAPAGAPWDWDTFAATLGAAITAHNVSHA